MVNEIGYRIARVGAIDKRSALRCAGAFHVDQTVGTADYSWNQR